MQDNERTIGNRIKTLRQRRRWSQEKLVEVAREYVPEGRVLTRPSISTYENGHTRPDSWVALALAQALGVSVEYLMGEKPPVMMTPAPELLDVVGAANRLPPQKRREVAELIKAGLVLLAPNSIPGGTTEPATVAADLEAWAAQWTTADELEVGQDQAPEGTLFDDCEPDADCSPIPDTVPVSRG